jgi:predicted Rossmann fold nucleotide-binding protein DprA/Smf involved in DNA uptake
MINRPTKENELKGSGIMNRKKNQQQAAPAQQPPQEPKNPVVSITKSVVNLLNENREMTLDEIVEKSGLSLPKIASTSMDLELKNVVRCLPGRLYKVK